MNKQKKLIVELFPDCNLNCSFCMQSELSNYKSNKKGSISKIERIRQVQDVIEKNNVATQSVEMWGGELFYDNSLSYTREMISFIKGLNCEQLKITTNLIWNLEDNILYNWLLKQHFQFDLCISYDPVGRYNNSKIEQFFKNNVKKVMANNQSKQYLYKRKVELETVLTKDVLLQRCDMTYLQYLNSCENVDLVFIADYRGYDDDIVERFHILLYELYKSLPNIRNVTHLHEPRQFKNNLCLCHQNTTTFLTYNNDFKISNNGACTYYFDHTDIINKFRTLYKCNQCRHQTLCKDMCPSILNRLGMLKEGVVCHQKYLYDRYEDITSDGIS